MAQIPMTLSRVHAIIASAFNLRASKEPALRARFPAGCRPLDASRLTRREKDVLLAWYEQNADGATLYTRDEARQARAENNF